MFNPQDFAPIEIEELIEDLKRLGNDQLWVSINNGNIGHAYPCRLGTLERVPMIAFTASDGHTIFINCGNCLLRRTTFSQGSEIVQVYALTFGTDTVTISTAAIF